jgi:predicted secreted hydrolase
MIMLIIITVLTARPVWGSIVEGRVYLEGESNHSGTRVEFFKYPLGALCDETFTDASGDYSKVVLSGYYDVILSRPGFITDGLSNVYIKPIGVTTLPSVTLEPVSCNQLNWHQYPYVPSGTSIWFPEDEGKHNPLTSYPIEWWYVNFHLTGVSTGHKYGAMVAFFKDGPMRLFSISDLWQEENYTHADLFGVLTASTTELDLHYTDQLLDPDLWWNKTFCVGGLMPFVSRLDVDAVANEDGNTMKLDVILASSKTPMIVDGDGFVHIGDGWSYYYSHTKAKVLEDSEITVHGLTEKVTGFAWIDHQWGDFLLGDTVSWEWFSIQLADVREIMVADVWQDGQLQGSYCGGLNFLGEECDLELLDDYHITPLSFWTDPVSGRTFAVQWSIVEASRNINLLVTADYNEQVMRFLPVEIFPTGCFWEGSCSVTGTIEGSPVVGQAYAELTHSWDDIPPEPIDDLAIYLSDEDIHLLWTEPYDDGGVIRYVVYRSTTPEGSYDSLAHTTATSYLDAGVTGDSGANHFYTVKAVDGAGQKSGASNKVGEFDRDLVGTED